MSIPSIRIAAYHNLGFNSCWSVDEEATFEEQVERVVARMRRFDHDEADVKGYKIISEWI